MKEKVFVCLFIVILFVMFLIPMVMTGNRDSSNPFNTHFNLLIASLDSYYLSCGGYPDLLSKINEVGCEKRRVEGYKSMVLDDPWGQEYLYNYPALIGSGKVIYDLYSLGEDGVLGTKDDINNWSNQIDWDLIDAARE